MRKIATSDALRDIALPHLNWSFIKKEILRCRGFALIAVIMNGFGSKIRFAYGMVGACANGRVRRERAGIETGRRISMAPRSVRTNSRRPILLKARSLFIANRVTKLRWPEKETEKTALLAVSAVLFIPPAGISP